MSCATRTCAPPRFRIAMLQLGDPGVCWEYASDRCPCCGKLAAWVQGMAMAPDAFERVLLGRERAGNA